MSKELFMEIKHDLLREFQDFRNDGFPPELAKLELGGISEQIYSVLRKIFSEYEGTYSKRIETFLGDKNSSCLSRECRHKILSHINIQRIWTEAL